MKDTTPPIVKFIVFILAFVLFCFLMGSCSILRKHKTVNNSRIDSVSVTIDKKDSSLTVDSSTFHKEQNTVVTKTDSTKEKDNSVITEDITEKHFDTSGKVTKQIDTHRKIENNKAKETSSVTDFADHSKIDSSEFKKEANVSIEKKDTTHVTKSVKEVTKDKTVKKVPVFQLVMLGLLILLIIYVVKNRKKIWGVIVHFFTGL